MLTSYSLLHSLQHLDALRARAPRAPEAAEAALTLFRCAEICLGALARLAARMQANLEAGNVERAVANARWRAGIGQLLYRLSALVVEVGAAGGEGVTLAIADSRAYAEWRRATAELRDHLRAAWPESPAAIFARGLDDARRFVFFNEFVDTGDERTWIARLSAVRLGGVRREAGESGADLYERVVRGEELARMLDALETRAETDLLPFRVVHQVSELLASHVNERFCAVVAALCEATAGELDRAARSLEAGNRLLAGVDDSVQLMLRALTPAAYKEVRSNLGMVRGTSSVVLRRTLFNATYPLLVRALRLRLADLAPGPAGDDAAIEARAAAALAGREPAERALGDLVRGVVVLHQHVRTWRDNHQQLPKTHLGASPRPEQPTVSLSGSESAVDVAHELRRIHATDPVAPFHRALLGRDPAPVHELLEPGGFDEYMAAQTALGVFEVYDEVQQRFYERRERRAGS